MPLAVIPAEAGIQKSIAWTPFAGVAGEME